MAVIPFFISLVLLVGFLSFRFWEERKGVRLWARVRDNADSRIAEVYTDLVTKDIPTRYRTMFISLLRDISHMAVVFAVRIVRAVERQLTRLSHRMRRGVPASNGKGPSEFLKTITPEKKQDDGTTPVGGV